MTYIPRLSLLVVLLLALGVPPAHAQGALDCRLVESVGNARSASILASLNTAVAGQENRINRRKTLVIHSVERVWFDGCRMRAVQNVTLKRRVRADAHGTVQIGADITRANLRTGEVCYESASVEDVSLSRTLGIGEAVYRWVANRTFPDDGCMSG